MTALFTGKPDYNINDEKVQAGVQIHFKTILDEPMEQSQNEQEVKDVKEEEKEQIYFDAETKLIDQEKPQKIDQKYCKRCGVYGAQIKDKYNLKRHENVTCPVLKIKRLAAGKNGCKNCGADNIINLKIHQEKSCLINNIAVRYYMTSLFTGKHDSNINDEKVQAGVQIHFKTILDEPMEQSQNEQMFHLVCE
jgi:predicted ATPase